MNQHLRCASALFLLAGGLCAATAKPVDPQPGDPLMFVMGSRKPIRVRVANNQTTLIELPNGQKVMNVFGADHGEGGLWDAGAGKIPMQFVAIKPKDVGIHTMLHVISNTGAEQSFALEEVTGIDTQFDAKVEAYSTEGAKDGTAEVKWVTADEVTSYKAQAEAAKLSAAEASRKAQSAADTEIAAFRHDYPEKMVFGYVWDVSKANKLGFTAMWRDDKFTYVRATRVLALYEVNEDHKPSLINYEFKNGLYTIPKLVYDGYFAIGNKKENKLDFHVDRGTH